MKLTCLTPTDTRKHAFEFAQKVEAGALVLLYGDLGAGKTEWVKGFVMGMNCSVEVTSPTFTLMHEYRGGKYTVYHWDLYRLGENTDWSTLDLLQGDSNAVTLVEWPEHFPEWPSGAKHIQIEVQSDESRIISIKEDI